MSTLTQFSSLIKGRPDIAVAYAKNWERRVAALWPCYSTTAPML
jgi:hypothetical protein